MLKKKNFLHYVKCLWNFKRIFLKTVFLKSVTKMVEPMSLKF